MADDRREQFLDAAEILFAERGFYGVSIAAVADELSLTKQALLHHFGNKEKLYGAVLQRISDDFEQELKGVTTAEPAPERRLKAYLLGLADEAFQNPRRTQLLMRELLDNKRRAESAGTWYLKSYLLTLTHLLRAVPGWESVSQEAAFTHIYQCLGAINYYAISQPTLRGIFGQSAFVEIDRVTPVGLSALIDAVMALQHGS